MKIPCDIQYYADRRMVGYKWLVAAFPPYKYMSPDRGMKWESDVLRATKTPRVWNRDGIHVYYNIPLALQSEYAHLLYAELFEVACSGAGELHPDGYARFEEVEVVRMIKRSEYVR